MKKETDVILYPAGAYGNFINWCYSYFSNDINDITAPLTNTGSIHNRFANDHRFVVSWTQLQNYLSTSMVFPVIQIHESTISQFSCNTLEDKEWFDCFVSDLDMLSQSVRRILYVFPTDTSISWLLNNFFYKVQPFKDIPRMFGIDDVEEFFRQHEWQENDINVMKYTGVDRLKIILKNELNLENFSQWGHFNIDEFKVWELRELSSMYFYDRSHSRLLTNDQLSILQKRFSNIMFVKLDDFRDNFSESLKNIMNFFNLQTTKSEIDIIHNQWLQKQDHIYKDQYISNIVNSVQNSSYLDYLAFNLTFFDELFIQRKLSDIGIELACYDMNTFPTDTATLIKLITTND